MKRVVVVAWLVAGTAVADPRDADDRNAASKLFEEGRQLDEKGEHEAACTKFDKSYTLDPAPGTALNLAVCAEKANDWRRAWELYDAAASVFIHKSDKRARFARERADQVLSTHPEVEVQPEPDKAPPPTTRVERSNRTGLKVITGLTFGLAAFAGAWWFQSYLTIQDYDGGLNSLEGRALQVPDDCNYLFIDPTAPAKQRFDDACDASQRTKFLVPLTLVSAVTGSVLLIYLLKTDAPTRVVPMVSGQSAGVTAMFEW